MTRRARPSITSLDHSWTADDPAFPDHALLAAAYAVSEWAIAVVGPLFWAFLSVGFLFVELARH